MVYSGEPIPGSKFSVSVFALESLVHVCHLHSESSADELLQGMQFGETRRQPTTRVNGMTVDPTLISLGASFFPSYIALLAIVSSENG